MLPLDLVCWGAPRRGAPQHHASGQFCSTSGAFAAPFLTMAAYPHLTFGTPLSEGLCEAGEHVVCTEHYGLPATYGTSDLFTHNAPPRLTFTMLSKSMPEMPF